MDEIRSGHASSRLHKSNVLTLHDNSIQDKNGLLDKNECRLLVDELHHVQFQSMRYDVKKGILCIVLPIPNVFGFL